MSGIPTRQSFSSMLAAENEIEQPLLVEEEASPIPETVKPVEASVATGSILSTCFTLTTTMVGGGILSLPYGFKSCGLGLGVGLLVFMGILSAYTAILLVKAGKTVNQKTMGQLASYLYGPWASRAICGLLVVLLQFSHVGYLVLLGDLTSPVLRGLLPDAPRFLTSRVFVVLVILLFVVPASMSKNLNALRHSSLMGIAFISIITATIVYRCFVHYDVGAVSIDWSRVVWAKADTGIFLALSLLSVSFLCHFSVLPLYNDMKSQHVTTMTASIASTMAISGTLFLLVALFGYLSFYGDVYGNILLNYDAKDVFIGVGRCGLALCLSTALPLLTLPERMYLREMFLMKPESESLKFRILVSLVVYSISFGVAVLIPKIVVVWSFFGSSVGVTLNYIIPGLLYYKVAAAKHPWHHIHRILAFAICCFGVFLVPVCIWAAVNNVLH